MNFLEQLSSEYLAYKGNFVRTNIKFNKRSQGGYAGEIDVIAYDPINNTLIHVETSTDANSSTTRMAKFNRKFNLTLVDYNAILNTNAVSVKQLAIVGISKNKISFNNGVIHQSIPEFIKEVNGFLQGKDPMKVAVPENYILLRTIQYSNFYG